MNILVPFPEMTSNFSNKPAATQRFRNAFPRRRKPYKTNGNNVSQKPKTRCGNPYKTCLKLIDSDQKRENGLQNHQFPSGLLEFQHVRNRNVENPYKTNENTVSQKSNLLVQNPYETCLKLMIFEPKSQNGLQNDPKSIRFIDKMHMAFHHVEKPYKTCRKWRVWRCHFRKIPHFGPLRKLRVWNFFWNNYYLEK